MDERWELVRDSLILATVSRAMLAVLVWLTLRIIPKLPLYPAQLPDQFFPSNPALDGWARWDAAHYIAVARYGYGDTASPSPDGGVGFFPLYPLLVRLFGTVTGQGDSNAGLAVIGLLLSITFFLGSCVLFARLAHETLGLEGARFATALFLFAPFAFFYTAVYTESLFLLEVLAAIWFARREQWWKAAIVAGLASATRLVGLSVIAGVLWAAFRNRERLGKLFAMGLVGVSGLILFFAYLQYKVDDFLAYFNTQAKWGGWDDHVLFYARLFIHHPRQALQGDPRHLIIIGNVAIALLCLALVPTMLRRLDPATAMISTLLIVGQFLITWVSLGRYLLPAIGIYFAAAMILTGEGRQIWRQTVLATSLMGLTGLTLLFAIGFWVV
jgi:hypothetical protein